MGRGGRFAIVVVATMLSALVLQTGLAAVGVASVGLLMPLFLVLPWLILAWYQQKERQRPMCPNCELPLSYRRLGPSHGMLECPALCGYRRLVGDPRARP